MHKTGTFTLSPATVGGADESTTLSPATAGGPDKSDEQLFPLLREAQLASGTMSFRFVTQAAAMCIQQLHVYGVMPSGSGWE